MKKWLLIFIALLFMSENVFASALNLDGNWKYVIDYSQNTVQIIGDNIINKESSGQSGTIKLYLYLTTTEYSGGTINGYRLGEFNFDPLSGGYQYNNIDQTVSYDTPPAGDYYATLVLTEYTNGEFIIMNYLKFKDPISFDNSVENDTSIVPPEIEPVEKDNSAKIQFWRNELARETLNLKNAEDDYDWALKHATNSASGLMLKQQRLKGVQMCRERVERCEQHLRNLGCYDY